MTANTLDFSNLTRLFSIVSDSEHSFINLYISLGYFKGIIKKVAAI